MKKLTLVLAIVFAVTGVSSAYIETFDNNNANWVKVNNSAGTSLTPATWENGGYISITSSTFFGVQPGAVPNATAYGDMTAPAITVDTKVTGSASGNAQFFLGSGGTYYVSDATWAIANDTEWTTHSVALTEANFTRIWGSGSLASVLTNPTDIGIWFGGAFASGDGQLLLDNYGTVPEPATIVILALGGLGLFRKRLA